MIYDLMDDCFNSLNSKIQYAIDNTDLDDLFNKLSNIKEPTLVTGVGGSSVVGTFLAKVLREKNNIIATFVTSRDLKYMNLDGYKNIISVSYSGNNIGVDVALNNNLKHYLLTGNPKDNCVNMVYKSLPEASYVSISATLVPMSLLLLYYKNDLSLLNEILNKSIKTDSNATLYQVMAGYETVTASVLLESSISESGMAMCIVHDKYNYCHGRINITKVNNDELIVFDSKNEIDELIKSRLSKLFNKITIIDKYCDDLVINDFYSSIISMKYLHCVAHNKNIDFSNMKEIDCNDDFYLFKGNM